MHWVVAAPYFETAADRWISDSVVGGRHRFTLVPRVGDDRNWHQASASAGVGEWADRGRQALAAIAAPADGIITVFPQLAATTAGLKRVRCDRRPLVAWLFNTEGIATGIRRAGARVALRQVDRFVVHSTAEIPVYGRLLGLPVERFSFVPLQYGGEVEAARPPDQDEPYVFATGTGYRDYETFFAAMGKLGHRTLVLASDRALRGLTVPDNVEILSQISRPEIRRLVRHAAVNVVPLTGEGTTAGLVTIVETFRHGRSMVITRRPGLDDYCSENENVLCADPGDAGELAAAVDTMWSDESERARLDRAALEFAEANCTDGAAAAALVEVLDSLTDQPVGRPG